jgi:hypothetical protein
MKPVQKKRRIPGESLRFTSVDARPVTVKDVKIASPQKKPTSVSLSVIRRAVRDANDPQESR